MEYQLVGNQETGTLVVMLDGELTSVSPAHVHFGKILTYLQDGGTDATHVRELLDARTSVVREMEQLSERVAFARDQITFDGEVIETALTRHILRLLREGHKTKTAPAVHFMEQLAQNPSHLSRIHLWTWVADRDFTLTPDGQIIGYKAVQDTDDNLSITFGRNEVTVDNTVHTGYIPNPLGAVVAIPRNEVDPHREHACSAGLHVGTWDYAAHDFGGLDRKVLTVSVNPRDVVAVPRDCQARKMRVCRYTVLDVVRVPYDTALASLDEFEDPEWPDDDTHQAQYNRWYNQLHPSPYTHLGA